MTASWLRASSLCHSSICSSCLRRTATSNLRFSSTEAAPALMTKIKSDLKAAMRSKDTARLNVLRSIISETNQQASGANPVKTDLQLLAMLKKRKAASQTAAKEFEAAHRHDLKEKEEKQISILDEYAHSVQLVPVEELKAAVMATLEKMSDEAKNQGRVMKELLQPGGVLDGKPVDKALLSTVVKDALTSH